MPFLIEETRRCHGLPLLLSRLGHLKTKVKRRIRHQSDGNEWKKFTFSAVKLSVVNFMLAAAEVRLSCCDTSPAFNERCSYFRFKEKHVQGQRLIR